MTTRSVNPRMNPATTPPSKTSVLGIILFLIGAPNLYTLAQKNAQKQNQARSTFPRIVTIALFAGAIASAIELSMF